MPLSSGCSDAITLRGNLSFAPPDVVEDYFALLADRRGQAGANSRAGSVDDGSTLLDFDEEAKAHKYTITSSLCHFTHHGKHVNLVNTPGYPDYIGQVIGALRAVENALIAINAAAGIEVNTRKVFHLAGEAGLGRMIVLNRLDQENIRFDMDERVKAEGQIDRAVGHHAQ